MIGNACGFNHKTKIDEVMEIAVQLSRRKLLQRTSNAPMLVINGADDYFMPQSDALVFNGRPDTDVRLIPGTGHCAMSKLSEVMPAMIRWLRPPHLACVLIYNAFTNLHRDAMYHGGIFSMGFFNFWTVDNVRASAAIGGGTPPRPGDASLVMTPPAVPTEPTAYRYPNPEWTVGTTIIEHGIPQPVRGLLTFTTEPLDHDTEVTGPIAMVLYVASDQTDTEFFVKISEQQAVPRVKELVMDVVARDVPPPSTIIEIGNGDSMIADGLFHHYYGHKVGCDLIYHDAEHPSHVVLPIIPKPT